MCGVPWASDPTYFDCSNFQRPSHLKFVFDPDEGACVPLLVLPCNLVNPSPMLHDTSAACEAACIAPHNSPTVPATRDPRSLISPPGGSPIEIPGQGGTSYTGTGTEDRTGGIERMPLQ